MDTLTLLHEASLSRFYQHFAGTLEMGGNEAPKAIAILTASRASLSKAENNKRNAELRKLIKMATYNVKEGEERIGFFKVIGTYAETQADGTTKRVKEDSTVVVSPANQAQKLKKMAMVLGAKFDQDSIFFAENGQAMLIYTRDVMDEAGNVEFKKGHITRLGAFHPQQLGMAFTKIKGKTFAFEWIGEQLEYGNPSCYNEAMMFESFAKHFDSSDDPLVEWEAKVKSVKEEIEQIEEGCKKEEHDSEEDCEDEKKDSEENDSKDDESDEDEDDDEELDEKLIESFNFSGVRPVNPGVHKVAKNKLMTPANSQKYMKGILSKCKTYLKKEFKYSKDIDAELDQALMVIEKYCKNVIKDGSLPYLSSSLWMVDAGDPYTDLPATYSFSYKTLEQIKTASMDVAVRTGIVEADALKKLEGVVNSVMDELEPSHTGKINRGEVETIAIDALSCVYNMEIFNDERSFMNSRLSNAIFNAFGRTLPANGTEAFRTAIVEYLTKHKTK